MADTFTPIRTKRLLIRRLRPDDAEALSGYRSRPEVSRYQSWATFSFQQAQDLVGLMEHSSPEVEGDWFQFGIELVETGQLIGDIGLLNTDAEGKSWIGFTLDPKHWRRGFAGEAVGAVLDYYAHMGILEVWASTVPQNEASRRLLERLGFSLEEETQTDAVYRFSLDTDELRIKG